MDTVLAKYNQYHDVLDKELAKQSFFVELEKKTGVPKVTMVLGAVSFIFVLIFFNLGGKIITDLIGWVYPAYSSFKAIESPATNDDVQWLTYWTVFGFVNIVEYFSDALLFWFPFYYLFKTLFVLWLALPSFRGAELIYKSGLRQVLLQYAPKVDAQASQLRANAVKVAEGKSF
jgi:receptor expression-enhancing protein 5/6